MSTPTFTPTPVVTGDQAADMPLGLGERIGASADANYIAARNWGNALEAELVTSQVKGTLFTPATNFSVDNTNALHYTRYGGLRVLRLTINRTAGAALVSTSAGLISATTMATRSAAVAPTASIYMVGRCYRGPLLNMYWSMTTNTIILRGCSRPSYTFPATWAADFEVWYF